MFGTSRFCTGGCGGQELPLAIGPLTLVSASEVGLYIYPI